MLSRLDGCPGILPASAGKLFRDLMYRAWTTLVCLVVKVDRKKSGPAADIEGTLIVLVQIKIMVVFMIL